MKNFFFTLVAFIFLNQTHVFSQEEITISRGGYGHDYPPYYTVTKSGETKGLCAEIIDTVALKTGIKVKYVSNSWTASLNAVRLGKVDAVIPISRTPEREAFLYFFDNILVEEQASLFVKKERKINFTGSLDDIKDLKIGVVKNYSYGINFDTFEFKDKDFAYNEDILLKRLVAGRIDIIIGDPAVMSYKMEKIKVKPLVKVLFPPVNRVPSYIAFSIAAGKKDLAKKFSDELGRFKKTKYYRNIKKRYGLN